MFVLRLRCYLSFFVVPHMDWVYISILHLYILGIFELCFFCFKGFSSATCANFFRSSWERTFDVINEFKIRLKHGLFKEISLLFYLKPKTSSCHAASVSLEARYQNLVAILCMHHPFLPRKLLCQLESRLQSGIVVLMCRTFLAWFGVCDWHKHFCKVLVYLPWKDILFQSQFLQFQLTQ